MGIRIIALFLAGLSGLAAAANRFEAESAIVDENTVQKVADAAASGGFYVGMKEGNLSFKVNLAEAGFHILFATYSQPSDPKGKIQNLSVNGSLKGQISFPFSTTFATIKASAKSNLTRASIPSRSSSPGAG